MRAFVAVLAAGLTLAACGSSSDTKSGAPATGGASATVTDTVSTAMAPVAKFAAPGEAVKAPAGKRVVAITCSSQGYGCVQGGIGVQEAGKVLGWNVTVADGKGDPATWNSAIQQAVTAKADGIVLLAVDPAARRGRAGQGQGRGHPGRLDLHPEARLGHRRRLRVDRPRAGRQDPRRLDHQGLRRQGQGPDARREGLPGAGQAQHGAAGRAQGRLSRVHGVRHRRVQHRHDGAAARGRRDVLAAAPSGCDVRRRAVRFARDLRRAGHPSGGQPPRGEDGRRRG